MTPKYFTLWRPIPTHFGANEDSYPLERSVWMFSDFFVNDKIALNIITRRQRVNALRIDVNIYVFLLLTRVRSVYSLFIGHFSVVSYKFSFFILSGTTVIDASTETTISVETLQTNLVTASLTSYTVGIKSPSLFIYL